MPELALDSPSIGSLLSVRRDGDVALVTIMCQSIMDRQAAILTPALLEIAKRHDGRLAIDLAEVADFSCAWINSLLALSKACDELSGKLVVFSLGRHVRDIMRATRLDKRLCVERDRRAAFKALGMSVTPGWQLALAKALDARGPAAPEASPTS